MATTVTIYGLCVDGDMENALPTEMLSSKKINLLFPETCPKIRSVGRIFL